VYLCSKLSFLFQDVIRASLQWETFEQYALWQLLGAHDLPLDCVLPLVTTLFIFLS
jgi:hypothetical protein